ncbi:MAG: V-type ATP synthase subunit D [Oscillospiraceae bacterium]|nr:V-type ATP synthase subunit D [Oscillospiraceae bacterium]
MPAQRPFATKGNLIATKKTLSLAKLGYELLDRKRNILIREMMLLIDEAKSLRGSIEETYSEAYTALQLANITMGVISPIADTIPIEQSITLSGKSVMGVELPTISMNKPDNTVRYGFMNTNSQLDKAYIAFNKVKEITVTLAQVENSIYRLAVAIKKTQRRANALKNIIIPNAEETVRFITNSLEEKEREEFSRLKVIKAKKLRESK